MARLGLLPIQAPIQTLNKIVYNDVLTWGHEVIHLVEALRYKLEGHGFESQCHWNFSFT